MNAGSIDDIWTFEPNGRQPKTEAAPALQIEQIDDVEPLDAQFGVDQPKTVPDVLYEAVFGQPDLTEAALAADGGDLGKLPALYTYAILDAAKVMNLPEMLDSSGLEHRCLFKGAAYDEMKDVAPWIVRLEEGNTFTRNLFTQSDAPWHFWDDEPGICLRSPVSLNALWKHLRKFTRLRDQKTRWHFFRFWEGLLIEPLHNNPHQFPMYQKSIAQIMADLVPLIVSVTSRISVRITQPDPNIANDKIVLMPDKLELRRLSLHRNMILAADDLFEVGPEWVEGHYGTRHELSLQLRQFIDFCLDYHIDDSDIRSHLMQLIFAHDSPRWPDCLVSKPFELMKEDKLQAEARAMDWIYATRFQLKQSKKGVS